MNAVNLIPTDSRDRRQMVSLSPVTLALLGGLVGVLLAAVLYVMTANTVATRKSELAQVSAGVSGWTVAGNSYASFVNLAKERTKQLTNVRQLASSRFSWADLLGQIGGLMPRAAALSSLQASTSSTAGGATSTTGATGASAPTVQLSGCAATQSVVAQTMVQLRAVKGVSGITLSSSSDSATGTTGQAAGGCPFPVSFQLAMAFTSSSATSAATPSSAAATSTQPTSATTTTTSAPAAAATTTAPVTAQ